MGSPPHESARDRGAWLKGSRTDRQIGPMISLPATVGWVHCIAVGACDGKPAPSMEAVSEIPYISGTATYAPAR